MQLVKYNYDKWTQVSIFQSYKGSLTIIGSRIKYTPQSLSLYKELLQLSNTGIIIRVFNNKRSIQLKTVLFKSLHYYNKHCKDKPVQSPLLSNHMNEVNRKSQSAPWFTLLLVIGVIVLITIFIFDFNAIKSKINQVNISKLDELQAVYLNNNCEKKGHLPALREFCQSINRDRDSLKAQTPTILSIFFLFLLDIFNNGYSFIGISNVVVTILIILLIRKLL